MAAGAQNLPGASSTTGEVDSRGRTIPARRLSDSYAGLTVGSLEPGKVEGLPPAIRRPCLIWVDNPTAPTRTIPSDRLHDRNCCRAGPLLYGRTVVPVSSKTLIKTLGAALLLVSAIALASNEAPNPAPPSGPTEPTGGDPPPITEVIPTTWIQGDCITSHCDGAKSCAKLRGGCNYVRGKWACKQRTSDGTCQDGSCSKCYD